MTEIPSTVYEDGSHDLAAEAPPTSKTLEDTDHTPVLLKGKEGDSPLVLAVDGSYGLAAVAPPMLQTKCLHFAAAAGALDTVHALLDDGADFTCPDLFGRVALHHAAAGGKIEIVRLLLTRGAIATLPDEDGLLPSSHVSGPESAAILDLLHQAERDPTTLRDVTSGAARICVMSATCPSSSLPEVQSAALGLLQQSHDVIRRFRNYLDHGEAPR